jgi:hypothetical protein
VFIKKKLTTKGTKVPATKIFCAFCVSKKEQIAEQKIS